MRFTHLPHPRIIDRQKESPAKVADHAVGVNGRLALWITNHVGTMWCAYLFTVIGVTGLFGALTNNVTLTLIFGAISSYVLQLVLLPVILVGQNLQAAASDKRAQATYEDASAVLNECLEMQRHLRAQDAELTTQTQLLNSLAGLLPAFKK